MSDKKLTAQKLHAILRGAGIEKSETHGGGRVPGWYQTDHGYAVETNGQVVYTCGFCRKTTGHALDCVSSKGASVKYRQRKVNDGTFTVRLHGRSGVQNEALSDAKLDRDRARIVEALSVAGIAYAAVSTNEWLVSGFDNAHE
jgi:phage replication-related protein YjqB (UPF0714/DUF867 family)